MQVGFIVTVLVGLMLHDTSSFAHDCNPPQTTNIWPKPREIRGFKPDHMSTAYGFGKREVSKQHRLEKTMTLLQDFPRSVAIRWLVHEMIRNPEFAKKVLRMVIADGDPDKTMTGDLHKAEQISYV